MSERHRISKVERIAYHEAGHAVAAVVEGRRLRRVTSIPPDTTLCTCSNVRFPHHFRPDRTMTLVTADRLRREIIIFLAGHLAEKQLSGHNHWVRSSHDRREAAKLADYLVGSEREHAAFMKWLWVQTEGLVQVHEQAIEAVAQALLKEQTLSADRVREVMRESQPKLNEALLLKLHT